MPARDEFPGFPTTHWTRVRDIQSGDPVAAREALSSLCSSYWYPIYAFLRRSGENAHDAEDITQAFFERIITDDTFEQATREKGKLRSFLLGSLKRLLSDRARFMKTQKRGGGREQISLDQLGAEDRYALEPLDPQNPETLFAKAWARSLLDEVREKLRKSYSTTNRADTFDTLVPFIMFDDDPPSHREIATKLGSSEAATRIMIFRLRSKFRDLLSEEVALTVSDPGELAAELSWIQGVLAEK